MSLRFFSEKETKQRTLPAFVIRHLRKLHFFKIWWTEVLTKCLNAVALWNISNGDKAHANIEMNDTEFPETSIFVEVDMSIAVDQFLGTV